MPDKFFLSASGPEVAGSLHAAGERVLWRGQCAVAEYAFDEPASLPRWTLPEETEVVITDQRVLYRDPATMGTGELHWRWPQHLRVQPGNRETGRLATVTQIQLVCSGPSETFPALVFAGGDVTTVSEADRLANVLRQAIARYRVEHAEDVGLTAPEARMLSRLVIGPEFSNYQGGDGQTVSLLGAQQVQRQAVNQPTVEVNLYAPRAHAPAPASTPPYSAPASTPPYSAPASTPPYSAPASTPPYTAPIAYPAAAAHAAAASPYAEAAPHPSLYSHVVDQPSAGYAPPSAAAAPSSGAPLPPPPRAAYPGGPSPSSAAPYPAGSAPSHAGPSPSSAAPYPTPSSAAPHQATTAPSSSSATPHPTPSHTAFRGGPSPSSAAPYPTPSSAPPSHAASHGEPTPSSAAPYSTPSHAAFHGGPSPSSAAPNPTSPSASPYSYPYPSSPAPFAEEPAGPLPGHTMRRPSERRGREPEQPRPWETQADLESRAADLAARVAMLVSGGTDLRRPDDPHDTETTNLSAYLGRPGEEPPPGHHGAGGEWDGRSRAEAVRRTATRLAGNAARDRNTTPHRTDDEIGAPTGGNHRR